LRPNFGIWFANFWSGKSKQSNRKKLKEPNHFKGADKEWLVMFCEKKIKEEHFDYFIFGHRHLVIDHQISINSRYINLGDWYTQCNYAEFDGKELRLKVFEA
jgi:UDP-2,3-diacylglucosamine hydrolase